MMYRLEVGFMISFCKKCLFPDTKPDLYFDDEGVCDACRSVNKNGRSFNDDWAAQEFEPS